MREAISLLISFLALGVAVYGIFERQKASFTAIRVRLTELVETIEELNVDESRYQDEHPDAEEGGQVAPFAFAGRRALLTYQSLNLLERLRSMRGTIVRKQPYRLTASEHGSLALSLTHGGDLQSAVEQWEDAVTTDNGAVRFVLAANYRGYGNARFMQGEIEAARACYRNAVEHSRGPTESDAWNVFQTFLDWARHERDLIDAGGVEASAEPVEEALKISEAHPLGPIMLNQIKEAATTTVYVNGEYQAHTLGADDE